MPDTRQDMDKLCVNTIRMLAVDMVEAANSGHPGMPLGAAGMAYTVFKRHLRFNPSNPLWPGRDRFVLSAGHASALLYAILHLFGYDLPLDELKNFRQWGSRTPGHPEYREVPGVEATTGPLGHGFAMGVGMALAQRFLQSGFAKPDMDLMDHYIYALVSDGDLMEGVSSEAASFAGSHGLGKLIYLYDDNQITIEGSTGVTFTENVSERFAAYGWQVLEVADSMDLDAIDKAIFAAKAETQKPSLIRVNSHIGLDSPRQDSPSAHGEPLGAEGLAKTKAALGWPDKEFYIPEEALEDMRNAVYAGQKLEDSWKDDLKAYTGKYPDEGAGLKAWLAGEMPQGWQDAAPVFRPDDGPMATRAASGKVLNAFAAKVGNLVGGSADLAPSNKTWIADSGTMQKPGPDCGRNIHFGVREHAMAAMVNGMALHGGVIPYGGTFFVFSDFMRPAMRLACIMGTKSIFVFTHDSVAVGEDGPTHQPIEQLMSLRVMPGLKLLRPADANESSLAWKEALGTDGPVAMLFSRQKLPVLDPALYPSVKDGLHKGAYVLAEASGEMKVIIVSSGAEVHLALSAREVLQEQGIGCRVVSMPSWDMFLAQDQAYRDRVLPPEITARVSVEAGSTLGWREIVGERGVSVGIDRFGASAPGGQVLANLGLNVDNVVAKAKELLG